LLGFFSGSFSPEAPVSPTRLRKPRNGEVTASTTLPKRGVASLLSLVRSLAAVIASRGSRRGSFITLL
jgi:hypothetical protein